MRRPIELLDTQYPVTVHGRPGDYKIQIGDSVPSPAALMNDEEGESVVRLGEADAPIQMVVKGETTYVRAFGRTFTLRILDPVEQAAQASGGRGGIARAPMPGIVVEVHVAPGDTVTRGQPMMIIESMKILTVIKAPREGEVLKVHVGPGQTFEKNAALLTLKEREER